MPHRVLVIRFESTMPRLTTCPVHATAIGGDCCGAQVVSTYAALGCVMARGDGVDTIAALVLAQVVDGKLGVGSDGAAWSGSPRASELRGSRGTWDCNVPQRQRGGNRAGRDGAKGRGIHFGNRATAIVEDCCGAVECGGRADPECGTARGDEVNAIGVLVSEPVVVEKRRCGGDGGHLTCSPRATDVRDARGSGDPNAPQLQSGEARADEVANGRPFETALGMREGFGAATGPAQRGNGADARAAVWSPQRHLRTWALRRSLCARSSLPGALGRCRIGCW